MEDVLQYQDEATTYTVTSSAIDTNGETLSKSTLFSTQQQAIRHSNLPHNAVDEPRRAEPAQELLADNANSRADKEVITERLEA